MQTSQRVSFSCMPEFLPFLVYGISSRSQSHLQSQLARRIFQRSAIRRTLACRNSSSQLRLNDVKRVSKEESPLIFLSTSVNPYHNLSIEDYILRNTDHSSRILLFYVNRPCVVIGRNQNPWLECNLSRLQAGLQEDTRLSDESQRAAHNPHSSQDGTLQTQPIDLVRRRSGGGTVFHDFGNLNYSTIVPNDKEFNRRKHAEMVVRALNSLQDYEFYGKLKVNDRHDIVVQRDNQWLKVSGSAFKLIKGRALHHGTLLCSSPNLSTISKLLNSPGRGYIQAKGVESVRSKVANLKMTQDLEARNRLRDDIINGISREFASMYGGSVTNEVVQVGDEDCEESSNPKIAAGVRELQANQWRFGQTPRFDFNSGLLDSEGITLQLNRGVIEDIKLKRAASDQESVYKPSPDSRIWEIKSWAQLGKDVSANNEHLEPPVDNVFANEALEQLLSRVFPYIDQDL